MYRDEYGLIVQANGDGGDTAQRTGFYWLLVELNNPHSLMTLIDFRSEVGQLEVAPGILVRHPYQKEVLNDSGEVETFRADPNHFSRDQQDVCVMACGFLHRALLKRIFKEQLKRYGRYQNKDVPQLQTPGIFIRAFNAWYLYPLLLVTDFGLLFSSISTVVSTMGKPEDVDDLNHIARLLQATYILPTPVSWVARKLYAWLRPKSNGSATEPNRVMASLVHYFRKEAGGNPEIAEQARPLVLKHF